MSVRPASGTPTEATFNRLLKQSARLGLKADIPGLSTLAREIQCSGHRSVHVRKLARRLGLNPLWLPSRHSGKLPSRKQ